MKSQTRISLQIFSPIHSLGPIHEISNDLQFVFVEIFADCKYFYKYFVTSYFVGSRVVLIGFRTVFKVRLSNNEHHRLAFRDTQSIPIKSYHIISYLCGFLISIA